MKTLDNLQKGDHVVFYEDGLKVEPILKIKEETYKVKNSIFIPTKIKKQDILAIENNKTGEGTIKGFKGNYDIINPEKLNEYLKNN